MRNCFEKIITNLEKRRQNYEDNGDKLMSLATKGISNTCFGMYCT